MEEKSVNAVQQEEEQEGATMIEYALLVNRNHRPSGRALFGQQRFKAVLQRFQINHVVK